MASGSRIDSALKAIVRRNYSRLIEVISQPEILNELTPELYGANLVPKELKDIVHQAVGLSIRQKACKVLDAVESVSYNSLENFLQFIYILKSDGYTQKIGSELMDQLQG